MKVSLNSLMIIGSVFLISCGSSDDAGTVIATAKEQLNTNDPSSKDSLQFQGFVVNAFEVVVDGEEYPDMETFYSHELANLPAKVLAAGYDSSYKVKFDAQIGFRDLWKGMTVYVAPDSPSGYQGQGQVASGGEFSIKLPLDARDDFYKVRATKRIKVVLTKSGETINICYNFSAVERSVSLTEMSKPIILDTFESRLTTYLCETSRDDTGIAIPGNASATELKSPISYGMTKGEVLAAIGADGLVIESESRWCWYSPRFEAHDNCAVNLAAVCQCYFDFNENDLAIRQYNIKSTYLDILSW